MSDMKKLLSIMSESGTTSGAIATTPGGMGNSMLKRPKDTIFAAEDCEPATSSPEVGPKVDLGLGGFKLWGNSAKLGKEQYGKHGRKKMKMGEADMYPQLKENAQLDELSNDTLGKYKKKAGKEATKADKEGDTKKANKRTSGIIKATKKEFDNDAKEADKKKADEKKEDSKTVKESKHNYHANTTGFKHRHERDPEDHHLDVEPPKKWAMKIDDKLWKKDGEIVTFKSKEAAERAKSTMLSKRPHLEIKIGTLKFDKLSEYSEWDQTGQQDIAAAMVSDGESRLAGITDRDTATAGTHNQGTMVQEAEITEEMIADRLKEQLALFKSGKDKSIGKKPADKEVQPKETKKSKD